MAHVFPLLTTKKEIPRIAVVLYMVATMITPNLITGNRFFHKSQTTMRQRDRYLTNPPPPPPFPPKPICTDSINLAQDQGADPEHHPASMLPTRNVTIIEGWNMSSMLSAS